MVDTGGEIKDLLASGDVLVNGEVDERRGRQLHPGDIVEVGSLTLRVTPA
ncbi:RNA-binding S4 domain-containing protein [Luedemannella flava]